MVKSFIRSGLTLFLAILWAAPTPAQNISVSGAAEVKVVPDEVTLTVGVETWNESLAKAKTENDAVVKRLFQAAKRFGIPEKQIQTDYINIEPTYKDRSSTQYRYLIVGYFVRKNAVVILREVGKFESLLTAMVEGGVTNIRNVEFNTTQLRKYRDRARSLAINAAKEKARDLVKELDLTLGKPLSVSESGSSQYYGGSLWWGSRGGSISQNVVENAPSSAVGVDTEETVALGQIGVKANVNVSFEMK